MKQVQIDIDLFADLCEYFFGEQQGEEWLADDIRRGLDSKLDKIIARELFTQYKRAPTGEEREAARKAYLDHRGILPDWRTEKEYRVEPE